MIRRAICVCIVSAAMLLPGVGPAADAPAPEAEREKLGYAIGHQVGGDFRRLERPLDVDALIAGLRDALARAEPRWSADAMRESLRGLEEARRAAAGVGRDPAVEGAPKAP